MPSMQISVIIIKTMLAKLKLNVPYTGGLGSFTLVILIAACLLYYNLHNSTAYSLILPTIARFFSYFE